MTLKKHFSKIKYELIFFSILVFDLIRYIPKIDEIYSWCTTPYLLTYKFGFSSKFLIGSLLELAFPYLSSKILYYIILMSLVLLNILVSILLGKAVRHIKEEYQNIILLLALVFLSNPSSVSYLFYWGNYGRLDMYLLIIAIIAVFFINNSKLKYTLPFLCLIGMAIHQAFAFTYLIIIIGIHLYDIYDNNYNKNSIIIAVFSLLISILSFIYFQFLSPPINYANSSDFINILSNRTNISISVSMIEFEYFKTISDHIKELVLNNLLKRVLVGIITVCMMLPIIIILKTLWQDAISYAKDKKLKFLMIFMMLSPIISLPAFILTVD